MSSIGRIGSTGAISRDTPSSGHELVDRARERELPAPRNQKVEEVAKMYEKQFLREMVKAMRGTVSPGMEKPSMAEGIYKNQLDEEYVESWGDNGGIGLSNLIYDQIMGRYFNSERGRGLKDQGPISLTDRDVSRVTQMKTESMGGASTQTPLRVELKANSDGGPTQLKSPWNAEVVHSSRVNGKTAVTLKHDGNLRSTVIFEGVPSASLQAGMKLEQGANLGVLSPEAKSFFWNISRPQESGQPQTATLGNEKSVDL